MVQSNVLNLNSLSDYQGFSIAYSSPGVTVANIGDFNKDGYPDLIIGYPYANNSTGACYVLLGEKELQNINLNDLTSESGFFINQTKPGNAIGLYISGAGDVNRDGYDDVIIGTSNPDIEGMQATESYVVLGNSNPTAIDLNNLSSYDGYSITINQLVYDVETSYSQVSSAGDVNSDGFDDVLIATEIVNFVIYGEPNKTNIELNFNGTIYSFVGGFMIHDSSESDDSLYGYRASGIGDFNKDGYDDIVIGTQYDTNYHPIAQAYVIYGKTNLSSIDLATFTYTQGIYFGYEISQLDCVYSYLSFSEAGDVNKDGYNDLIIGIPAANNNTGIGYVLYGGNNLSNVDLNQLNLERGFSVSWPDIVNYEICGPAPELGFAVGGGGDINGDGYDDILISSPFLNLKSGTTYIVYGSNYLNNINLQNLNATQGYVLNDTRAFSNSGFSISNAGDMNNDGYDDLIVSFPGGNSSLADKLNHQNNNNNSVSIVYGSYSGFIVNSPTTSPAQQIITPAPSHEPTTSLSAHPSFRPSVIPTFAPTIKPTVASEKIYLDSLSTTQGISITGIPAGTENGCTINYAGDVNGDGYSDVIIGNGGASESYIIFGSSNPSNIVNLDSLSSSQGFTVSGAPTSALCQGGAYFVSSAGDYNGDGFDDIIVSDSYATANNKKDAGITYVIYGKSSFASKIDVSSLTSSQGFSILGANGYDQSGQAVACAGDVNGDGLDDIIIGAPFANSNSGKAYVIYGTKSAPTSINLSGLASSQGFIISGSGELGTSLDSAGDMNKDGYGDIVIGAPNINMAYVIYGGSYLSTLPSNTLNLNDLGTFASKVFSISGSGGIGYAVEGIGDFNKDTFDDIILGAPTANSKDGASYIVYGSSSTGNINLSSGISTSVGISIYGAPSDSQSGYSIYGAGDVNKDGFSDVIISAPYAAPCINTYQCSGVSYVIYGGASLNNINNLQSLNPTQGFLVVGASYSSSGISVSTAGDFNNDGYSDLFIGAPDTYISGGNYGESYVVYGNAISEGLPTFVPTMKPSNHPTNVPTFMPTQAIYINSGGSYNGTGSNQNFIIDSPSDVTIYGGGSNNMFTLEPNPNVLITITNFNNYSDLINLKSFEIYNFDEVNITAGSVIITLEDNQIMKLLELTPGDISADNFVFAPEPADGGGSSTELSQGAIAGIALGGAALLGILGYSVYAYTHHIWPFSVESLASQVVEIETSTL